MFVWNFNQRDRKPINPRYMPGLDGVRAVAVIAIIIYHLNPQWLSGGFLGVDTFFVISGYLITSLLLTEYHNTGKIELMSFWLRRVKRLIPAVLFLVMGVIVLSLIFMPTEIQKCVRIVLRQYFMCRIGGTSCKMSITLNNLQYNH